MMTVSDNIQQRVTSKHYEMLKAAYAKTRSYEMIGEKNHRYGKPSWSRDMKGEGTPMFGKHHSEETKQKMSDAHKGKQLGEDNPMFGMTGDKNPFYNHKHTHETIDKMKQIAQNRPIVKCPYCDKEGSNNIMKRWHFNNCKYK